jgi:hypothetical protein
MLQHFGLAPRINLQIAIEQDRLGLGISSARRRGGRGDQPAHHRGDGIPPPDAAFHLTAHFAGALA